MTQVDSYGVRDAFGAVADVDEGKREVLVDIPWEVIDTYRSDFARDCFDEYLNQRLPVMCWQHDKKEPIGRAATWEKGQRANRFVSRFSDFDAVPRARQAFTQIRDGDITDFSFYFDQAQSVPHPQTRGAVRFMKARMPEISPVTVGSIPGAVATGVREAADAAGVAELVRARVISEEEGRRMLGLTGSAPSLTVTGGTVTGTYGSAATPLVLRREVINLGDRSVTITVSDDGSISTEGNPADVGSLDLNPPDGGDPDEDSTTLALAVDAALDQAAVLLDGVDTSGLPEPVQQALGLLGAAGVAVDALLDELGVPDPDEDTTRSADGERAVSDKPWSEVKESDYTPEQWKNACLIVLNDGAAKDDCKLPVKEPDGTLNRNGVHAAASALAGGRGGVQAPTAAKVAAAKTLLGYYKQLDETPPDSLTSLAEGKRSDDDEEDVDSAEALLALDRIRATA